MENEFYITLSKTTQEKKQRLLRGDMAAMELFTDLLMYQNNKNGECYPSYKRLAADNGVTEKTIQVKMKKLEKVGLIKITRKKYLPSQYKILTSEGFEQRNHKKRIKKDSASKSSASDDSVPNNSTPDDIEYDCNNGENENDYEIEEGIKF